MSTPVRHAADKWPVGAWLRAQRRQFVGLGIWVIAEGGPGYLTGRLIARATDHGFLAHRAAVGLGWLAVLAITMAFGAYATRETTRRLAGLVEPFRDELVTRAVKGSLRRSIVRGAPPDTAAVARLTQHTEMARDAYGGLIMLLQGFVVMALSTLIGLWTLVPAALVLVLPPFLLALGIFVVTLPWAMRRQRASIQADEDMAQSAGALAAGLRDVVACGGEELVGARAEERIQRQAAALRSLARVRAVRSFTVSLGGLLPLVLILVGAPWLLRRGATTGMILGALTYVLQGVHPALQQLVHGVGTRAAWLKVTVSRIVENTQVMEQPDGGTRQPEPLLGGYGIQLQQVTFRYGPLADPVITGFDLEIPEDDHLAVIGPSGVGKSTLAGLVAGMLRPEAGDVTLGGASVSALGTPTLSNTRVLIPQEAYVFAGTLRENLTAFRQDDVTDDEIESAVDELGVPALVERLGGYGAQLRPELLSAGERQLISVVRSYLSPAPVVVLDEATCHLDPAAEAVVEEAFARRHGTLVVIAHRLSSALRARRILLMDGAATYLGTHEELLATSALYRDLVGYWTPEEEEACGQDVVPATFAAAL